MRRRECRSPGPSATTPWAACRPAARYARRCSRARLRRHRGEPVDEPEHAVERRLQHLVADRIAQADPAVVTERRTRHQGHAFLLHEPLAEGGASDRGALADAVHTKEEIEGAVGLHELDARGRGAKSLYQVVAPAP